MNSTVCSLAQRAEVGQNKVFPEAAQTAITQGLKDSVRRGDTSGVVALVAGPNGVLYEGAAGKLGSAPSTEMPQDAIFLIASMTKRVTSVATMRLVEAGKIKFDGQMW